MSARRIGGTQGYAETAATLLRTFEAVRFDHLYRHVRHLFPTEPARILDIGAGSGRDAAEFAAKGHDVVAVEPVAELRRGAAALHPSPRIRWVEDSLPDLMKLDIREGGFDLVLMSAVWMHLDVPERRRAMPRIAGLLRPGGKAILSLRYGEVPVGRRMFEASVEETLALAVASGLQLVLRLDNCPSANPRNDATWTWLALSAGRNGG